MADEPGVVHDRDARRQTCWAATEVVDGVGLVSLRGAVSMSAVPVCRQALDTVLRRAPEGVVIDLRLVRDAPAAVPVLGLIRRYLARRGVRLVLAGPGEPVAVALRTGHVLDLYEIAPSVRSAVALAGMRRGLVASAGGGRRA